jgi:hypothetical protein
MNIFYSKHDLEKYPQDDISLLSQYFQIPNDVDEDDLLWLIALNIMQKHNIAFMPPETAWKIYSKDLLERFKTDHSAKVKDAVSLPIEIIEADPTPAKKYLEWIITSYLDGGIKLFEDLSRVKIALQEYLYLLNKKLITDKYSLDINTFCGLGGCKGKSGLDDFLDREEFRETLKGKRKEKEIQIKEQDVKHIYEDEDLIVVSPLTEEASCKYGAGTKWCTAATRGENLFTEYTKDGPLYILIPKKPKYDGEKYQVHIETK